MLQSLSIQNFAIIEQLSVDFSSGMSVLTGETGAGKSIIIDAVSLLSGARSSSSFVRHGSDKAVLQALFDIENNSLVQELLKEYDLPNEDNQLIVYREMTTSGKGVVRINGILSSVSVLKRIMSPLIDIHGQHEHQQLMDESYHLNLLDTFASQTITPLLNDYQTKYRSYVLAKKHLKSLMLSQAQDDQKLVMLKQHLSEIGAFNPKNGEFESLTKELKVLLSHENTARAYSIVDDVLTNETSSTMDGINRALQALQSLDDDYSKSYVEILLDVLERLKELSKDVSKVLDHSSFDANRLEFVQSRLSQFDILREKYGDDVVAYYEQAQQELDVIENKDTHLAKAQEVFMIARDEALQSANVLSLERKRASEALSHAIHQQLSELYMEKVVFSADFKPVEKPKLTLSGYDEVSFMVSTNSGEPLKPLAKVASGGELSRLMLALKVIFSKQQGISTLIFDEIDTGVSGRVAQAIAQKMAVIGQNAQVLCVTHLPQVAAIATNHLFVSKLVDQTRTATKITTLTMAQREQEVAKMFAGDDLNENALAHARELLKKHS